jgi:predicted nucleotidyltransferase
MYRSIEQRKADEAARRAGAPDRLRAELEDFARRRGGRYILYGSLARGEARYDSDIDLLVDFPAEHEPEAWSLAERVCAEIGIESDIRPLGWCKKTFLDRALRTTKVIP